MDFSKFSNQNNQSTMSSSVEADSCGEVSNAGQLQVDVTYTNSVLILSERDSRSFAEMLKNPPKPSVALVELFN